MAQPNTQPELDLAEVAAGVAQFLPKEPLAPDVPPDAPEPAPEPAKAPPAPEPPPAEKPSQEPVPRASAKLREVAQIRKRLEMDYAKRQEALSERLSSVEALEKEIAELKGHREKAIADPYAFVKEHLQLDPIEYAKLIAAHELGDGKGASEATKILHRQMRAEQAQKTELQKLQEQVQKLETELQARDQRAQADAKLAEVEKGFRTVLSDIPEELSYVQKIAARDPDRAVDQMFSLLVRYVEEYPGHELPTASEVAEWYEEALQRELGPFFETAAVPSKPKSQEPKPKKRVPSSADLAGTAQPDDLPEDEDAMIKVVAERLKRGFHIPR